MSDAPEQNWHGDHNNQYVRKMLNRLQQHQRVSIAARVAQRSMSTFSLQPEPVPEESAGFVQVIVYPQNPFVGEAQVRRMSRRDIQSGLMNSRLRVQDSRGIHIMPDDDGNYLYLPGDPRFDAVNAFYYATYTLRMFERYAYRAIPWAFNAPRIMIDPHAGDQANAFYNEQAQLLGFHTFTVKGIEHSTAASADIVSHEAGHAVLDGLRYLYNETFSLGGRAFHESFGDMAAVLVALHDESLVHQVVTLAEGNLRGTNFISEIAEYLIKTLKDDDYFDEHTIYLRNAVNTLTNRPFDDLDFIAANPGEELSRQEHNYSRLFTGAFYDILTGIYEHFREHTPMPDIVALHQARDAAGRLLVCAIELGPAGELSFADMARAFLTADVVKYEGVHTDLIKTVFANRQILTVEAADAHLASLENLPAIQLPDVINTSLAATQFLEDVLVQALDLPDDHGLTPLSVYRNAIGQVYMSYFQTETVQFDGEGFESVDKPSLDIFGGLTLMFDHNTQLRSVVYRPINDEDRRQLQVIIADLIRFRLITPELLAPQQISRPFPKGLHLSADETPVPEGAKLVRYPVMFDNVPDDVQNLGEHLQNWEPGN
ncbi:MAG: hypothetical protein ACPG7F_04965 [Aggregatilineales bacterium]